MEVLEEDGCKVVVPDSDRGPFSWMRYIVMSEEDFRENLEEIALMLRTQLAVSHSMAVGGPAQLKGIPPEKVTAMHPIE